MIDNLYSDWRQVSYLVIESINLNVKHGSLCVGYCDKRTLSVGLVFSMLDCDNNDAWLCGTIIQLCTSIVLLTYVNKITYFVDKFNMFNSINKYFTRLSPNQIELRELLDGQASRAAREARDVRETVFHNREMLRCGRTPQWSEVGRELSKVSD